MTNQRIKTELRSCTACGEPIADRYLLEVGGCTWHGSCLRCCICLSPLDRQPSCFLRERQVYCKADYAKNFGAKCSKCCRGISSSDWVRRARELVFHLACFACDQCGRQLSTGEQYALLDDRVLCKSHYMETVDGVETSSDDGGESDSYHKNKAKRVRTTFTEEQLQVLQANFQIDSNPDGQDLERIASVTGLSKRVTQVWFQNSRARQKKHIHAVPRENDQFGRHINLQLTYSFQQNTTHSMHQTINAGGLNSSTNKINLNNNSIASKTNLYHESLDELSEDSTIQCMQGEV
ncbi:hypothetical protein PVAND_006606 [Polypedilum vanderplanki]|uniref:Arrowhead n=1 Tax=Polypedilum vanderplanki TaxID=319348 RepID=A0A9J6C5E7_POLVA|nr:hypothetical protein PVAND_006606 [Polypedilum vanderplanki]